MTITERFAEVLTDEALRQISETAAMASNIYPAGVRQSIMAALTPLLATVEREQERLQAEVDRLRRTLANDPSRAGKRLMNLANALSTCDTCEAACDDVDSPVVLCGKCHQFLTARVQALEAERTWQDIASAPRDGTVVLGWHPSWEQPLTITCEYDGDWYFTGEDENKIVPEPTHWQPLPLPPAIPQASKEPE